MSASMRTMMALWKRDLMRFFRQPSRVVGAVGQPILFWVFFGAGFAKSFQVPGAPAQDYAAFFFPGILSMTLLFTAIFSTVSVIEDRREGFLQAVMAGPAHRSAIALGKTLGGASLAMIQAGLLLVLAPLFGIGIPVDTLLPLVLLMVLGAVALTALSFGIAWSMRSSQGYHAVMSVFLIPMWLLSGSMFPISGTSPWLGAVMRINPLSYAVDGMRRALYGDAIADASGGVHLALWPEVGMLALSTAVLVVVAMRRTLSLPRSKA